MVVVVAVALVVTVWLPMVELALLNELVPKANAGASLQAGLGGGVTATVIGDGSTAEADEAPITM